MNLAAARDRTPETCEPNFIDEFTRVAVSGIKDAGNGLFACKSLPKYTILYEYTGKEISIEVADRYPNAYMIEFKDKSCILDASQEICSPAKFVNRNIASKCNCEFVTEEDRIYLITSKDIAQNQELFVLYTTRKEYPPPAWPMIFPGCAEKDKSEFAK